MATKWVVDMTFDPEFSLEDKQLDLLSDRCDEMDWSVALGPDGSVAITAFIENEPALETTPVVVDIAQRAMADVGAPGTLVKVTVMSEQRRELELITPQLPELLAATDIAKVLGVSRQRVNQLCREHRHFPQPVVQTGAGFLWTKSAVEWFASVWDRRPGRRAPDDGSVVDLRVRTRADAGHDGPPDRTHVEPVRA